MDLNISQLLGKWILEEFGPTLPDTDEVLSIRQIPPVPGRVFTHRFKLETATFDGTGNNPHDIKCIVVGIDNSDRVFIITGNCNEFPDF